MDQPVDLKPRPNRARYIEALRRMTPEQRLLKALELSQTSRELMRSGLRELHPHMSEQQIHALYLERLERCRRRTY